MKKEDVFRLATDFRGWLEVAAKLGLTDETSIGKTFPHASCDDSSHLLAAFLADRGVGCALRVSGIHGGCDEELGSHVWLMVGDLIVDITADQFERYEMPPVFVGESSSFHSSFRIEEPLSAADFRQHFSSQPRWLGIFSRVYEGVLASGQM